MIVFVQWDWLLLFIHSYLTLLQPTKFTKRFSKYFFNLHFQFISKFMVFFLLNCNYPTFLFSKTFQLFNVCPFWGLFLSEILFLSFSWFRFFQASSPLLVAPFCERRGFLHHGSEKVVASHRLTRWRATTFSPACWFFQQSLIGVREFLTI